MDNSVDKAVSGGETQGQGGVEGGLGEERMSGDGGQEAVVRGGEGERETVEGGNGGAEGGVGVVEQKNKFKSRFGYLMIGLVVGGLMGIGVWFFWSRGGGEKVEVVGGGVEVNESVEEEIGAVVIDQVEYEGQSELFESVTVGEAPFDEYEISFFRVGEIEQSPYEGGVLVLAKVVGGGGKGPMSGVPRYDRYIWHDGKLIFLPRISSFEESLLMGETEAGALLEVEIDRDDQATILELETPETMELGGQSKTVSYGLEVETEWKIDEVELVLTDPVRGEIYTTKTGMGSREVFVFDDEDSGVGPFGRTCPGEGCLLTNGFYWPRPDGTMAVYEYVLPEAEVYNSEVKVDGAAYTYVTRYGCGGSSLDFAGVVYPKIETEGLETAAMWGAEAVYVVGSEHELVNDFYAKYQRVYGDKVWKLMSLPEMLGRAEFGAARPVLVWTDPWGRQLRLVKTDLLPPIACEPVIYLYAPEPTEMEVSLGSGIRVLESEPVYRNGWRVRADVSGELVDLDGRGKFDYLFWEGRAGLLPRLETGFVVEREGVDELLGEKLHRLGLNEKEIGDFKRYWLRKLTRAPFVAISFYDQAVIDEVYPVKVEPVPETSIRVLMDYRLLERPVEMVEPKLPPTPERQGVTLVEWGGLER